MKSENKLILIGGAAVLLWDALNALSSQLMAIPLAFFCIGTFAIYFSVTYRAASRWSTRTALAFGAYLAFVDASGGWMLMSWLREHGNGPLSNASFAVWAATAFVMIGIGLLIAFLASLAVRNLNRRRA